MKTISTSINSSSSTSKVVYVPRLSASTPIDARVNIHVYYQEAPEGTVGYELETAQWIDGSKRIRLPKGLMNILAFDRPAISLRGDYGSIRSIPAVSRTKQLFMGAFALMCQEIRSRAVYSEHTEFVIQNASSVYWYAFLNLLQTENVEVTLTLHGFADAKPFGQFDSMSVDNTDNFKPLRSHEDYRNDQVQAGKQQMANEVENEVIPASEEQLAALVTPAKKPTRKKVGAK